jgi:DAACS family dicarboxylate/amino acid:cation (Na+ or H+) symporter
MVNLLQPGAHLDPATLTRRCSRREKASDIASKGAELNFIDLLIGIVPHNIIAAAADDKQKLGVVFFALMFGIGLVMTPTPATQAFKHALQGLFEICMRLIG